MTPMTPVMGTNSSSGGETALATQPLSTTYSLFRTPLTLDWEIDLFGRVRRGYEVARAEAVAAQAAYQNVAVSLTANVAIDHFALRALDAELGVLERTIKVAP
jgi:multidrug efflux system outer membrane protein